jgi:predicted permease
MATLTQDLRYGLRILSRSPGFTVVAVLTLALGIGANTAIFSVVEGVLLSPLPYAQPDRLANVYESNSHFDRMSVSYLNFKDWQRDAQSFESMAAYQFADYNLTSPGQPEHTEGKNVSAGFFSLLGVKLRLGREFAPQEDQQGGAPVAIISSSLWEKRFGGSRNAVGEVAKLDGRDYTVIGVLPQGFGLHGDAEVYIPLGQGDPIMLNNRKVSPGIKVIARLKPGVTLAQAQSEMANIQRRLDRLYPDADEGLGTGVVSLKQDIVGDVGGTLLTLLGAVGLVLLIACANVANLLLARATARDREFAIRSALGANRGRVVRQLLTESVLLAVAGAGLGLLVASWGVQPVLAAVPGSLPRSENIGLNVPVLLFTLVVAVGVGILFGLAPALKSSKANLQEALKEGGRTSSTGRHGAQKVLVVFQMALTLMLLVAAGLMFRTIQRLWDVNPGFDAHNVLTFSVGLSPSLTQTASGTRIAYRQLLDRLGSIPGVRFAAVTDLVPLDGNYDEDAFSIGTAEPESFQQANWSLLYITSPGYLHAMGIPLLRGRFLSDEDTIKTTPVVVIDNTLAQKFFPGKDPIGHALTLALLGTYRIIGVAGHVKHFGLASDANSKIQSQMYFSVFQVPDQYAKELSSGFTVMVNTRSDPMSVIPAARRAVYGTGRDQPVYNIRTMQEIVSASMSSRRFPMLLLGSFAALALALASVGLYGVISYSVSQRAHEIGIRMALGAQKGEILRMVIGQGLKLATAGVAAGIIGALALTRLLSSLLYGIKADDPETFLVIVFVLIGVAVLACYIPARRATKVDPVVALRYE